MNKENAIGMGYVLSALLLFAIISGIWIVLHGIVWFFNRKA